MVSVSNATKLVDEVKILLGSPKEEKGRCNLSCSLTVETNEDRSTNLPKFLAI